jgi:hypothetical protein
MKADIQQVRDLRLWEQWLWRLKCSGMVGCGKVKVKLSPCLTN